MKNYNKEFNYFYDMLQKQDKLNKIYKVDLTDQEWAKMYYIDLFAELGELLNSFYYKHWTKEYKEGKFFMPIDKDNVIIEIVDIIHFLLSIFLVYKRTFKLEKKDFNFIYNETRERDFKENNEVFVQNNYTAFQTMLEMNYWLYRFVEKYKIEDIKNYSKEEKIYCISELMTTYLLLLKASEQFGYTIDDLYKVYIEKNKVNFKRQEKDYSQIKNDETDNKEIIKKLKK